jgi:hypothetical protein
MMANYGLAALEVVGERPEWTIKRAALAHYRRATEYEFRVCAGELLAELEPMLPPDVCAAAVERGAVLDPNEVVPAILQEEDS